ncbi:HTH-type transcriptional regulator/antitoxin HigA [Mycolicibacterium sp. BK634]|uniref:HigA family addiction module antitoxin n=1 Tax=Mycolicibacterium sp. BK634 TaxID=2587099 RepID=UPI00160B7823|nr:HigA family addiction module antitoxin [Mycolicibacterium sp. BK634]MBB3753681.1 HTH-type transcriptional regulator/antitoxin HigA [Mycolicibacterium sp. BK634]
MTGLAEVFPAGEHLAEELEHRGWTQVEFAEILGRPAQFVSEIMSNKKEITRESAAQIAAALGTSAEMWLNLQDSYFLWKQSRDKATQDELGEVRIRARLSELAPMPVLRKRGIITSTTTAGQVQEVKKLFKLDNLMDEPKLRIAARRANTAEPLSPIQNTWLACVEQILPNPPRQRYSKKKLEALAKRVSQMVREPAGFESLPQAYAEAGVRLVYVEAFPSSKLSGASFLLDGGPVIALSGLRQRLDIVLFTLLHETAHVVRGDIEKYGGAIIDDEDQPHTLGDEDETDELAASWILPQEISFVPGRISQEWVDQTANSMGVHPIVIVGRLQKLEVLPWRTALVKDAPNVIPYLRSW